MSSISEYMPEDFAQTFAFEDKPVTKPKTGEEKAKEANKAVATEAAKAVIDNTPAADNNPTVSSSTTTKNFSAKVKPGQEKAGIAALKKKVAGIEDTGPKSSACKDKKAE